MSSSFQPNVPLHGAGIDSTVDSSVLDSADLSVDESIEVSGEDLPHGSQNGSYALPKVAPATGRSLSGIAGSLTRLGTSSSHLPNLEPHQHSTLFYLSLIEGRCRTQAAYLLNEGRHPTDRLSEDHAEVCALARPLFAEMSKELHKAGILPDEFAGQDLEDLRGKYLHTFDTILQNIATTAAHIIPDHSTGGSNLTSDVFALTRPSPISAMEKIVKRNNSTGGQQSLLSSLILRGSGGEQLPTSIFQTQYGPKSLLGKGGFGQVFRVRNLVDDREYAVKRIVIRCNKVNLAGNKTQQQALLMEARSLSKLNHQNIVRYYGAWVETCPAGIRLDGDTASTEMSYSDLSEESDELLSRLGKLGSDNVSHTGGQPRSRDLAVCTQDESDVFDHGLPATTPARPSGDSSHINKTIASPSASVTSPKSVSSRGANSESEDNKLVPRSTGPRQTFLAELDAIVFIKMDLYPMTLEEFLWADLKGKSNEIEIQHCFHTSTTARILSAILDGVEYIHSKGMVHRDLKPGNILLSIHHGPKSSSLAGSIDINDCSGCSSSEGQHTFITPHIGDFGLVAEIRKPLGDSPGTPRGEHVFEPSELARLAPAGSKLYLPQAPVNVICPKLDVYSLGVIGFELLYKFGTKTERVLVLGKLKQAVLPADFENHELASGIKAMICGNRDERWTCADTRKWLEDAKERYGQV